MILDERIIDTVAEVVEQVIPFLLTEDGKALSKYLSSHNISDFLYNVNGRDRLHKEIPGKSAWESLIGHFKLNISLRLDISEIVELVNTQMRALHPTDSNSAEHEHDTENDYVDMSNNDVIVFLFLMVYRNKTIAAAAETYITNTPA